jgi:hypothetical protein
MSMMSRANAICSTGTAPSREGNCSIRRECLDHVVVFGEWHLHELLANYATYYNTARTHLALDKDAPLYRPTQTVGRIASVSWLGGLHQTVRSDG